MTRITQIISITIPKEILKEIDAERGDIPRSKWICKRLKEVLTDQKGKLETG